MSKILCESFCPGMITDNKSSYFWHNIFQMRHVEFVIYKYFCRLSLGRSFKSIILYGISDQEGYMGKYFRVRRGHKVRNILISGGWCQGRSAQACAKWLSTSIFLHRKKRGGHFTSWNRGINVNTYGHRVWGGSMRLTVFYRQVSLQFYSRPTSPGAELPTSLRLT